MAIFYFYHHQMQFCIAFRLIHIIFFLFVVVVVGIQKSFRAFDHMQMALSAAATEQRHTERECERIARNVITAVWIWILASNLCTTCSKVIIFFVEDRVHWMNEKKQNHSDVWTISLNSFMRLWLCVCLFFSFSRFIHSQGNLFHGAFDAEFRDRIHISSVDFWITQHSFSIFRHMYVVHLISILRMLMLVLVHIHNSRLWIGRLCRAISFMDALFICTIFHLHKYRLKTFLSELLLVLFWWCRSSPNPPRACRT